MTASFLALSVPEAVLSIDGRPIKIGKQPALCLGKIQGDGFGLTTGGSSPEQVETRRHNQTDPLPAFGCEAP